MQQPALALAPSVASLWTGQFSVQASCEAPREHGVILFPNALDLPVCQEPAEAIDRQFQPHEDEYEIVNGMLGGHLPELADPELIPLSKSHYLDIAKAFLGTDRVVVLPFMLPSSFGPAQTKSSDLERYLADDSGTIWTPELYSGDLTVFPQHMIHESRMRCSKRCAPYRAESRAGGFGDTPESYHPALFHMVG